ncbi:MAG TPA: lysophospholipid acyltransferase family protein [Solimonas sp.]|nr:lysophospholipid acyltransferase family protein [Solimonas sp.]
MLRRLIELVYAPLAAAMFVLVCAPVCLAIIVGPTLAVRRETGRLGARLVLAAIGIRIRVRGLEHLPPGPCIVVSNHASYLDGLVLTAALPRRFTFVVQDGAERWPLVGLTIRRMGVSFVNREEPRAGAAQTRALIRALGEGESLVVFAEGTFKAPPGLLSFKKGAFLMAARAQVPVVPCAIRGTRHVLGGARRRLRWGPIGVELRPALAPPPAGDRPAALLLRDRTRQVVLELSGEPDRAQAHHAAEHAGGDPALEA